MAGITAKITAIDTVAIDPTPLTKNTPIDDPRWRSTSEISFIVDVEAAGKVYTQKLTFRVHREKIFNFGGVVTKADVEAAIMAEVAQIESLMALKEAFTAELNTDQVAKIKSKA